MDLSGYRITISNVKDCPCFQAEDQFDCSGNAVVVSADTHFCMDFAESLIFGLGNIAKSKAVAMEFKCVSGRSGCKGQVAYRIEKVDEQLEKAGAMATSQSVEAVTRLLLNLPMFKSFDQRSIDRLLSYFHFEHIHDLGFKSYRKGNVIIQKGQPGTHLYIIVAGRVEVVDEDDNTITYLSSGEVFGEMSLISGNPISATIKADIPTTVFRLDSKDFNSVLPKFPELHTYFARLLTQRLVRSNRERNQDLTSGMAGKLSEMPPDEVLQTLNITQKTGVLEFSLADGPAKVFFIDGEMVHAEYGKRSGIEAVAAVVQNQTGKFNFTPKLPPEVSGKKPLGNFMGILMNSLKDLDEQLSVDEDGT
jgi:CRP/FNR family transcriptional regulator, cyclic AMP receptor protein